MPIRKIDKSLAPAKAGRGCRGTGLKASTEYLEALTLRDLAQYIRLRLRELNITHVDVFRSGEDIYIVGR